MVTKKPKGLGRGLEALLGPKVEATNAGTPAAESGTPMMMALEQMVAAYVRLYGDPGFDLTALDDMLVGNTGLVYSPESETSPARILADFAKEHEELEYKGGIMDGAALDPDGFRCVQADHDPIHPRCDPMCGPQGDDDHGEQRGRHRPGCRLRQQCPRPSGQVRDQRRDADRDCGQDSPEQQARGRPDVGAFS